VKGAGFRVQGLGLGLGCRVQGSEFRVQCSWAMIEGEGRVQGLEFSVKELTWREVEQVSSVVEGAVCSV
jgi:hypothetical protein